MRPGSIVVAGLAAAAVLSCANPETPPLPEPPLIAFHSSRATSSLDIFTIDLDGLVTPVVVEPVHEDRDPDLSPDRSRIVFASNRSGKWGVYLVNADGSGLLPLVVDSADNTAPSWAPDGQRLVFARGGAGLYTVNANGTGLAPVGGTQPGDVTPAWSSDGSRIAFENSGEIVVVRANGTNRVTITTSDLAEGQPAWTPGDSRIVFYRNSEIISVMPDGSDETNLTAALPGGAGEPAISPDGLWLIYTGLRVPNFQILKRRLTDAGSGETLVTMAGAYNGHPSWR